MNWISSNSMKRLEIKILIFNVFNIFMPKISPVPRLSSVENFDMTHMKIFEVLCDNRMSTVTVFIFTVNVIVIVAIISICIRWTVVVLFEGRNIFYYVGYRILRKVSKINALVFLIILLKDKQFFRREMGASGSYKWQGKLTSDCYSIKIMFETKNLFIMTICNFREI